MKFVFWIPQTKLSAASTGARVFRDIMLSHRNKKKMHAEIQPLDLPGEVKGKKYFN